MHEYGYLRTETVHEPGEYAIRGSLIDVYSPLLSEPVRLDLFGETIDSMHCFNPLTQRRTQEVTEVTLTALNEVTLNDKTVAHYQSALPSYWVGSQHYLHQAVVNKIKLPGYEHLLPLFYPQLATIFDYLSGEVTVVLPCRWQDAAHHRWEQINEHYNQRLSDTARRQDQAVALEPFALYLAPAELSAQMTAPVITYARIGNAALTDRESDQEDAGGKLNHWLHLKNSALSRGDIENSWSLLRQQVQNAAPEKVVLVATHSQGAAERMAKMLQDQAQLTLPLQQEFSSRAGIVVLPHLSEGFGCKGLWVIHEHEITKEATRTASRKSGNADNLLNAMHSLRLGDFVVHQDHGVAQYQGLVTLDLDQAKHDFCLLLYDNNDKLFLPVENLDLISRYSSDLGEIKLDRLGSSAWQTRKSKVRKRLQMMAEELIKVAAQRLQHQVLALESPGSAYEAFCSGFPHLETEEQLNAINDTLQDLAAGHPMDRLICGDVGFGKTEVALRAAFVVAYHGFQVLVVTPTTLLCRQHYLNFRERFKNFNIKVAQLSRLASNTKAVREEVASGSIQILITTHAAFHKGLNFKNLGLVIVDEEQHFGVAQKEMLKNLHNNAHLLTLSATPIPRTLQMSIAGLRELSLIATPPIQRLPIRTTVLGHDPKIIREALLREYHRGGQSFYVCPYVQDLEAAQQELAEIVPDLSVITVHGQMPRQAIETAMESFYQGQYNIMLATNIIESGIDLPRANTLIITQADRFGLSQLYQIRGRIGRGKVQAYAYLTLRKQFEPGSDTYKRLEVINTLDYLGAGFALASYDMDIRGAGNLLGAEQSGHIREVGVEMYQTMLEEAMAQARHGNSMVAHDNAGNVTAAPAESGAYGHAFTPVINAGVSILIPEEYIPSTAERIDLYQRCSRATSAELIEQLAMEMIDRYGALPPETENLLHILKLKLLCWRANISKLDVGPHGVAVTFYQNQPLNSGQLIEWLQRDPAIRLSRDNKLSWLIGLDSSKDKINRSIEFVEKILKL